MHDDDIHETPSSTPNFRTELAAQLAELAPEVIADGKVDVAKLQELLDGDAAEGNERFGLFWPGKKRALRVAQEPTTATLKPDFENSKDWDTTKNVFIEGDNLEVLKILQRHYHGKIKMIYIDPPYNTGKDFVYPDNFREGLQTYLEYTGQVDESGRSTSTRARNTSDNPQYHSAWLNMMYPRLKLARNLLADDGVIFISIDDNEMDNLRKICNEIFGEQNSITGEPMAFVRGKTGATAGHAIVAHEYVLAYARNRSKLPLFKLKDYGAASVIDDRAIKRVSSSNPESPVTLRAGLRFEGTDTTLSGTYGTSETMTVHGEMTLQGGKLVNDTKVTAAWAMKDQLETWLNGEETFDSKGQKVIEFYLNKNGILRYKKHRGSFQPRTLLDKEVSGTGTADLERIMGTGGLLSYPKPVALLRFLLSFAASDDDLVLDFFAGSGTTAHAVMEQNLADGSNRRFILVQLPEPVDSEGFETIADIARRRIRLAGRDITSKCADKLRQNHRAIDLGFRSFKLGESNFSKWRVSSEIGADQLEQHLLGLRDSADDDSTPDDLFTEILLKQGFSLTERIEPREVADLNLRAVLQEDGDLAVLAHLDEHTKPTLEQLRAMVDAKPSKIIVLEDTFRGDDQLKTNLAQLCKSNGIELWTA